MALLLVVCPSRVTSPTFLENLMNEQLIITALSGWHELNRVLNEMTEEEIKAALNIEQKNQRRKQVLIRLHRRFCMLRMKRERAQLLECA